MSEAGALISSPAAPSEPPYCTGSTASQLDTRMKTKMVTASGSTNGAIFMPIAASTCWRIWMVMASKNSCTPPGTPVEVTLDLQEERQRDDDDRGDRRGDDGVAVEGHAQELEHVLVGSDVNRRSTLGGEEESQSLPSAQSFDSDVHATSRPLARIFFITGMLVLITSTRLEDRETEEHARGRRAS